VVVGVLFDFPLSAAGNHVVGISGVRIVRVFVLMRMKGLLVNGW